MKILIATDVTLHICDNKIYAKAKYATIFSRYYNIFGSIYFCCRVKKVDHVEKGSVDITEITENIIEANSLFRGLLGKYNEKLCNATSHCDLVISRCPSIYAYRAFDCAKKMQKPVLAESMGCAWDAYWNHGIIGKLIAPYMYLKMRSVVCNADYASYVTDCFLQKRYPRKKKSIAASNVLIQNVDDSIIEERCKRTKEKDFTHIILMTTAAVDVKYKGQEYVIKAIPEVNRAGIAVDYYIVGEGDCSYLKDVAQKHGVESQVHFLGTLTLNEVLDKLDETDIYIQPSLQEGLPRSVIEAMSRGCICIGAKTAGIPELLDDKYVVRRKNTNDISNLIIKICHMENSLKIQNMKRNFEFSKKYLSDALDKRRNKYYETIKIDMEKK